MINGQRKSKAEEKKNKAKVNAGQNLLKGETMGKLNMESEPDLSPLNIQKMQTRPTHDLNNRANVSCCTKKSILSGHFIRLITYSVAVQSTLLYILHSLLSFIPYIF